MVRRVALVLCLLAPAVLAAAEKLIGGPFVVNVSSRSATVAWVVQTGDVQIGTEPGALSRNAPVLRSDHVTFSGLKPGSAYYYEVPGFPEAKGQFKTAPVGPADFQFVVFGDTRTRHEFHQRVVAAILKTRPDFVIHTGDLVSDGSDTAQWPIFFSIERELLRNAVFYPVLGNHERNNPQYYEFFDVKSPFYSFNWGNLHFTLLNSDVGNAAMSAAAKEAFWQEQLKWLEEDLAKSQKSTMRFVAFHHPPFTAMGKRAAGTERMQADFVPLFEKFKVTAVFNGHDHNYQHHEKNGVNYIVTGGGGAPLYTLDAPIPGVTKKVEKTEHYVTVKVAGDTAIAQAIALDGHVIDTVELK